MNPKTKIENCPELTVLDRQGLEQAVQMRLRTGSVDSEKLEWEVSSACSWASSTVLNRAPQSPHLRETPAIDAMRCSAVSDDFYRNGLFIYNLTKLHLPRLLAFSVQNRGCQPTTTRNNINIWYHGKYFRYMLYFFHFHNNNYLKLYLKLLFIRFNTVKKIQSQCMKIIFYFKVKYFSFYFSPNILNYINNM